MALNSSGDVEIYGQRIPRADREATLASLHAMLARFTTTLSTDGASAAAREAERMMASKGLHPST